MIGGLVAMTLDKSILHQLGEGRRSVVVTGTNGKSTTTRMTAAALGTLGHVATNAEGANMDAGLVAAQQKCYQVLNEDRSFDLCHAGCVRGLG